MRILLLLHPGVEELEAVGPTDMMRRAGLEVTLASTSDNLLVKGRNQIILSADVLLEDIEAEEFDALVIPGGPGVTDLRKDGSIANLAKAYASALK
ncbi:MAG: DJ-1/PfpI family protein, partial [Opitutae bacterium]